VLIVSVGLGRDAVWVSLSNSADTDDTETPPLPKMGVCAAHAETVWRIGGHLKVTSVRGTAG